MVLGGLCLGGCFGVRVVARGCVLFWVFGFRFWLLVWLIMLFVGCVLADYVFGLWLRCWLYLSLVFRFLVGLDWLH